MNPVSARVSGPRHVERLGPLDPRTAAWRTDLADISLAGRVAVPHYVAPVVMEVVRQTPLLTADHAGATAASELLPGERFSLLDSGHGHGWGFSLTDRYVGHVALDALVQPIAEATHMIGPGDALVFAEPDIKSGVLSTLPAGARVTASPCGGFAQLREGYVHSRHLLPVGGDPALDWVEVARNFTGAPYRWGGRTRAGIDCSGLVQMARLIAGHPCRRDSDMQAADAREIPGKAARGDIACWPGHIGILTSPETLLHANAHWMRCLEEPLAQVSARAGSAPRILRL